MTAQVRIKQTGVLELEGVEERLDSLDRTASAIKVMMEAVVANQVTMLQMMTDMASTLAENTASDMRMEAIVSDLSGIVDDLETRVTNQTTVIGGVGEVVSGAVALLQENAQTISQLRDELANAGVDPAIVARLQAVGDNITAGSQVLDDSRGRLGAAVLAGTPAEDTEPTPGDGTTPTDGV